jgi:Holliday junction resolvase RusA-like endonuclease
MWKPTRPDGDNVLKGIADASQGLLVADDGQYADQAVRCFYASQEGPGPRVEVLCFPLDPWTGEGSVEPREAP